jgi:hypothetical protein
MAITMRPETKRFMRPIVGQFFATALRQWRAIRP